MTRAEYYKYLEQTFDSFTKKVIKNKSIDILREYSRQAKREVSLSELSLSDISMQASVTDTYQPYRKDFNVKNYVVQVTDPVIGELLQQNKP